MANSLPSISVRPARWAYRLLGSSPSVIVSSGGRTSHCRLDPPSGQSDTQGKNHECCGLPDVSGCGLAFPLARQTLLQRLDLPVEPLDCSQSHPVRIHGPNKPVVLSYPESFPEVLGHRSDVTDRRILR